jgi:hypothetical protein
MWSINNQKCICCFFIYKTCLTARYGTHTVPQTMSSPWVRQAKFYTQIENRKKKKKTGKNWSSLKDTNGVFTSCITELYISNSCSTPWYDCDRKHSWLYTEPCFLCPSLSAPPVAGCLRRSVHGTQKPSLLHPLYPFCRVLASPSTYIRVKQWGGVPHSTLVPRWDRFAITPNLGRSLLHHKHHQVWALLMV